MGHMASCLVFSCHYICKALITNVTDIQYTTTYCTILHPFLSPSISMRRLADQARVDGQCTIRYTISIIYPCNCTDVPVVQNGTHPYQWHIILNVRTHRFSSYLPTCLQPAPLAMKNPSHTCPAWSHSNLLYISLMLCSCINPIHGNTSFKYGNVSDYILT
jgi:hypothetical protein